MKKTGCKTAVVLVLAAMLLAGEAFAGPGGRGRGQGRGAGWGPGMQAGPGPQNPVTAGWPRMGARLGQGQAGRGWMAGGPYCPFSQRPGIGRGWQGGGRGRGAGGLGRGLQGRGRGGYGQGFGLGRGLQGRGQGGYGQGFGLGSMMMRRRQMMGGRGWQGPGRGAGGRGFQGRPMIGGRGWQGPAGQGRVPGWRSPGMRPGVKDPDVDRPAGPGGLGRRGVDRPDPDLKRPWAPREDTDQARPPMRPRGGGRAPGWLPPGMRGGERDPNADAPAGPGGWGRRRGPATE